MSGRRSKLQRKAAGISIRARRDQQEFARQLDAIRERMVERRMKARRQARVTAAWFLLAALVATFALGAVTYAVAG
jgi:hypothetical protein